MPQTSLLEYRERAARGLLGVSVVVLAMVCASSIAVVRSAQADTIAQASSGDCSPNIANITGNVTVTCTGVDPAAMRVLEEKLAQMTLTLSELTAKANEWTERYNELKSSSSPDVGQLIKDGRFDEARAVLDNRIAGDENDIDRAARDHFNRAQLHMLQFDPEKALPDYKKAYQYRPDNREYAFQYADVLQQQRHYRDAEKVYANLTEQLGTPADAGEAHLLGKVWINLGVLFSDTYRPERALDAYQSAAKIAKDLSSIDPLKYGELAAISLNNLASAYMVRGDAESAKAFLSQSLEFYDRLVERDPKTYLPLRAATRGNLAIAFAAAGESQQATDQMFGAALSSYRELDDAAKRAHMAPICQLLVALAQYYSDTNRMAAAQAEYDAALAHFEDIAKSNPQAYAHDKADMLLTGGFIYWNIDGARAAKPYFDESLRVFETLIHEDPALYGNQYFLAALRVASVYVSDPSASESGCRLLNNMASVTVDRSLVEQRNALLAQHCN